MFFIGIFGIENKEKEIMTLNNFSCKNCNRQISAKLFKRYDFFHFFFIPLFKWNIEYYVVCSSCNSVFSIPKEKGKAIEDGQDVKITYWDLNEMTSNTYSYNEVCRCSSCGKEVDSNFDYCPYCGNRIKPY